MASKCSSATWQFPCSSHHWHYATDCRTWSILRLTSHRLTIDCLFMKKIAFMYQGKQCMFKKVSFVLKPLSSLFQRGMLWILGDLPFVSFFIDGIVIYSKNREKHAKHAKHAKHVKCIIKWWMKKTSLSIKTSAIFSQHKLFLVDIHGKWIDPTKLTNIHIIVSPLNELRNAEGTFKLND